MSHEKTTGSLSITRRSDRMVAVKIITDSRAHVEILLSLEDYGRAVTGESFIAGDVSLFRHKQMAMRHERRTEMITISGRSRDRAFINKTVLSADNIRDLLADGWIQVGSVGDSQGDLKTAGDNTIARVQLERWVEK